MGCENDGSRGRRRYAMARPVLSFSKAIRRRRDVGLAKSGSAVAHQARRRGRLKKRWRTGSDPSRRWVRRPPGSCRISYL